MAGMAGKTGKESKKNKTTILCLGIKSTTTQN